MLLVDGRGNSAHLRIAAIKAEEMTLSLLSHVPVDLQTDVRLNVGSGPEILKLPQP